MMIKYCNSCDVYTIKKECPRCNKETLDRKPPKWSPEDKYGSYRRKFKKEFQ